jgi:hypothetical protein
MPSKPAQFRYKPGFKGLPDHDAIRRTTRERSERFTRSSSAADCIVIWQAFKTWFIAELSGLGGLFDLIRSNALIERSERFTR